MVALVLTHANNAAYLGDRSLSPAQMRFVELIVERLTAQGVMAPEALYEAPFTGLHAGGPDGMFADRSRVLNGVFGALKGLHEHLMVEWGSVG